MRILLWDDDPALEPRTGDGEDGKTTARTRAEQRCATGNRTREGSDQNGGRPTLLEEDAQEESVSERLIVRSSDGD